MGSKLRSAIIAATGVLVCGLPGSMHAARAETEVAPSVATDETAAKRAEWDAVTARIRDARNAGQVGAAIPIAEEALRIAEQAFGPTASETLTSVYLLAIVRYDQGDYARAAPLYARWLAAAESNDDAVQLIIDALPILTAVNNLAVAYKQLGRYAEAAPLFERALRINKRWMGEGDLDNLRLLSALIANNLSDPSLAASALAPARTLVLSIRERRRSMTPGVVNEKPHNLNRSFDVFQKYGVANVRALRDPKNNLDAFVMLADAAWAEAKQSPGDASALQGEVFTALQDAISGVAAKAVEEMAVRLAAQARSPALGALVRDRQNLDVRRIANEDETAEMLVYKGDDQLSRDAKVYSEGYNIKAEIERLDARLHKEYPDYFTRSGAGPLDVAKVQRLLKPDEAILLAVHSSYGTHVMALSKSAIKWQRVPWDGSWVAAAVKHLLWNAGAGIQAAPQTSPEGKNQSGYAFNRKVAFTLYRQLIEPVAPVLAGKRHVFIAAGGVLSSFPFGILVTEPPQGADGDPKALRATRWFADAHALITIPSVQSLQFLRERPVRRGAAPNARGFSFAGYGDPALEGKAQTRGAQHPDAILARSAFTADPSPARAGVADVAQIRSLARLPGTAVELESMRRVLRAPPTTVHLQQQATESAVRSANLSSVRILAFATHGLMAGDLAGDSEPGLVFTPPAQASAGDDGFLTSSEVSGLKLNADWVILSACNTAAGDGSEGAPGLSGLARAFFYAGARNLLVSHWPVRDDVASRITVDAIRRQQANPRLSRAEAFQQAMRAIRNDATHDTSTDTWAHPNAWAPFALIGDGAR